MKLEGKHVERQATEEELECVQKRIKEAQRSRLEVLEEVRLQVREVKAMKYNPPLIVRRSIEAVYTLLECKRWADKPVQELTAMKLDKEWPRIQRALSNDGFVDKVLSFEVSALDSAPHVAEFVVRKYFPQLSEILEQPEPTTAGDIRTEVSQLPATHGMSQATDSLVDVFKKHYPVARLHSAGSTRRPTRAMSTSCSDAEPKTSRVVAAKPSHFAKAMRSSMSATCDNTQFRLPPAAGLRSSTASESQCDMLLHKTQPLMQRRGGMAGKRAGSSGKLDSSVKTMMSKSQLSFSTPDSSSRRQGMTHVDSAKGSALADVAADPLNLDGVKYASRACDVFVRWAIEVLREFLTASHLRRLEAATRVQSPDEAREEQQEEDRHLELSEERHTQQSWLPRRRPEDVAPGSDFSTIDAFKDAMPTLAKACEKRATVTSAKCSLLGRVGSPLHRGRFGFEQSPPDSPMRMRRESIFGIGSSSAEQSPKKIGIDSSSAEQSSKSAPSTTKVFSSTDLSKLSTGSTFSSPEHELNSAEHLCSSAYSTATSLANLIGSSTEQLSNLAAGAAKLRDSGEQSEQLSGTAKVMSSTEKLADTALNTSKTLNRPEMLHNLSVDNPGTDQLSSPATTTAKRESPKERRTPKWAAAFADMCFINTNI